MSVCVPFPYPVYFCIFPSLCPVCLFFVFVSFLSPCLPSLPVCLSSLLVGLSVSLSVSLSVCLCLYLSVCLSLFLSVSLFSFLSFSVSLPPSGPFVSSLSVLICFLFLCLPALPIFLDHFSLSTSMCVHTPLHFFTLLPGISVLLQTPQYSEYHPSEQCPVVSALSLTRLQLSGTNSLFLSAILPLSALLNLH